jgi:inhibitor of cysteine peptidase
MGEIDVSDAAEVQVSPGDTVRLRLPENATTGYVWSVAELAEGLILDEEHSEPSGDVAPGAAGLHVFTFRAVAAGQWQVGLRLGRAWESSALDEHWVIVRVG